MRLSDRVITEAQATIARLNACDGHLAALPEKRKAFILVYAAQGVIDNGGLEYFFEEPWPTRPPYQDFVWAYRTIGATEEAAWLAEALTMFPLTDPHLHDDQRLSGLMELESNDRFNHLSGLLCGDERVWLHLEIFVDQLPTDQSPG